MKLENTEVFNFGGALRGMRNPMNSWDKSDSYTDRNTGEFVLGEQDLSLAQKLIRGGSEHRKFMRQIFVSVDITAPLYFYKELETYKVGTVANSTSTMHKLTSYPITKDCFETDDYVSGIEDDGFNMIIDHCEELRKHYLKSIELNRSEVAKIYWKALVRILPESWLQTRTWTGNYENLYSMVRQRRNHKLNEWSGKDDPTKPNFVKWCASLPYAKEFLFLDIEQDYEYFQGI